MLRTTRAPPPPPACGEAKEIRTHMGGAILYKEEWEVLEGEMREVNKDGVDSFHTRQ